MRHSVFFLSVLVSAVALAAPRGASPRINPNSVLMGYESTFQTEEMSKEHLDPNAPANGMIFATPHKLEKIDELADEYIRRYPNTTRARDFRNLGFKPGLALSTPDSLITLTMEPSCIEWNGDPVPVKQLAKKWSPVYATAEAVGMKSYFVPTGESSGGGNLNVGGRTMAENPFLAHPSLLRNVLVYMHKHSSLLYGLGGGWDKGKEASQRDFRDPGRQQAFLRAVHDFDTWYLAANEQERKEGPKRMRELMRKSQLGFHNDIINLSHFQPDNGTNENFRIEFRGIRALPTAEHVQSVGNLIFRMMEKLSDPALLVPVEAMTPQQVLNEHGTQLVEEDWRQVSAELKIRDPKLNELIAEYTQNEMLGTGTHGDKILRQAYSSPEEMDRWMEVIQEPGPLTNGKAIIHYGGEEREATVVRGKREYWVAVFDYHAIQRHFDCREAFTF